MIERRVERGAQVLDALHEVVHVDVVRVHVDVPQALDQQPHRLDGVVHAALQHAWLRTVMPRSKSLSIALCGDAGDLVRVVEVRVEHHLLVQLAALLDDARQRVGPRVVGEDLLRHDRRTLGREAHAADVRHRQQRVADLGDLLQARRL